MYGGGLLSVVVYLANLRQVRELREGGLDAPPAVEAGGASG